MNERIITIRKRAMRSVRQSDPRSGELRKESMDLTEGEPAVIREAKSLAHYYRNRSLAINDGELVVGDYPRLETDEVQQPKIFGRQNWQGGRSWSVPDHVGMLFNEGVLSWAGNHKTLDYQTIFSVGFRGLCEQIDGRAARLDAR